MPALPARRSRVAAALGAAALVVVAVTGCAVGSGGSDASAEATQQVTAENGVDSLDSAALLEATTKALEAQPAFRVRGNTTEGALDLAFVKGAGAYGTVTTGGNAITVLATGGKVWVKGDAAFYESLVGQGSSTLIGDKWVELPATSVPQVEVFTDGSAFLDNMIDPKATLEVTDVKRLDGGDVVGAQDTDGGGTLWVAAEGEPLPLRFDERGAAGDVGVLRFVDYGVVVPIAAPAPEQIAAVPVPAPTPAPAQ